jgi:hypothetical protein
MSADIKDKNISPEEVIGSLKIMQCSRRGNYEFKTVERVMACT